MSISKKVKELFEKQNLAAIGTANTKGIPNVIAVAWKKLLDDDTILIVDNFMKMTKNNILENENICVSFWDAQTMEAYKVKGVANYHTEGQIYNKGKEFIQSKLPDQVPNGVVEVKVREIYDITPGPNAGKKIS